MNELLLEIGCEEIPARVVPEVLRHFAERAAKLGDEYGLPFTGDAKVYGSPRRLTLSITGLPDTTKRTKKELLGPSLKAAFDAEGKPTRAAEGFAKTTGIPAEKLPKKQTPKGEYLFAEIEEGGEPAAVALEKFLRDMIAKIPFPKSMRWGEEEVKFSRPVQWLLAAFAGKTLPLKIGSIEAGQVSRGHRFMANGPFEANKRDHYVAQLREAFVVPDPAERRQRVLEAARAAAKEAGGFIYYDTEGGASFKKDPLQQATYFDSLLDEVAFLCETPYGVYGTFDKAALDLPNEVVLAAMRNHQRYFAVCDKDGKLLPAFVTIAATRVNDPAFVRRGNERALQPRLADGSYFFNEDQKRTLESRIGDLKTVTYHKKIGSSYQKVERTVELAAKIAAAVGVDVEDTKRAAWLAKADLTTLMVGEFPELQGIVGAHYAKNEKPAVREAISDHYRPRSAEDEPADGKVAAVLAIADKLDTIGGIIGIGQMPTGSSDPFALRRSALGVIRTLEKHDFDLDLATVLDKKAIEFISDRFLNYHLQESPDIVRAVVAVGVSRPLQSKRRIDALKTVTGLPEVAALLKRAQNIIKEPVAPGAVDAKLFVSDEERALHTEVESLLASKAKLDGSAAAYATFLTAFTGIERKLHAFFEAVMVNDKDEAKKTNRLRLLRDVVSLISDIADFSKV